MLHSFDFCGEMQTAHQVREKGNVSLQQLISHGSIGRLPGRGFQIVLNSTRFEYLQSRKHNERFLVLYLLRISHQQQAEEACGGGQHVSRSLPRRRWLRFIHILGKSGKFCFMFWRGWSVGDGGDGQGGGNFSSFPTLTVQRRLGRSFHQASLSNSGVEIRGRTEGRSVGIHKPVEATATISSLCW